MMNHLKIGQFLLGLLVQIIAVAAFAFNECADISEEPSNGKRTYRVTRNAGEAQLVAVPENALKGKFVFEIMNEDVRFTNYKCWDKNGNITGFDAELIAEILTASKIEYVRFLPTKWENIEFNGEEQLSFFANLNSGKGHAAIAGMSITDERLGWGEMVGPIYKAGKKLMARNDNPKISNKLRSVPQEGYEALRGLSAVVQGSNIRGQFFRKLKEMNPDLVEYATFDNQGMVNNMDETKFMVIEVEDYAIVNAFVDSLMREKVLGVNVDLVMVDTGSTLPLKSEGKLGIETSIVTGNLATDASIGQVFGAGDGIALRKGNLEWRNFLEKRVKKLILDGTVNRLVEKWFQDENSADHSWAKK